LLARRRNDGSFTLERDLTTLAGDFFGVLRSDAAKRVPNRSKSLISLSNPDPATLLPHVHHLCREESHFRQTSLY
jgi:hypothetical protein